MKVIFKHSYLLSIKQKRESKKCEIAMQMSCDLTMAIMQKSRSYKPHDKPY
jgi:hypothetical protein